VSNDKRRYDVAFYVPWIGPLLAEESGLSTGGAETQVFLLSRALARLGLRVCLLVFEIPGVRIPRVVDGVDVILRPPYKPHQRILGKVRETMHIRAALASVDYNVVVTRAAGPHVGLIALFGRRARFVFASASPRDFDFVQISPKRRDRVLLWLGMRMADEIVVQTDEQRGSCLERLGRTPVLIRSLCELPDSSPTRPDAFLWIGRYNSYKRPLEYIKLARTVPEAKFRMVISSATLTEQTFDLKRQVKRAASELPNLELAHSLPRPELMNLVRRAVAIVSTSEFEGMSNVLLEGWAHGIPALVFSYDSDGIVEANRLGHVAGGSSSRFEDLARDLWASRHNRRELSMRCRAYVEDHHALPRVAEQWAETLTGHPRRVARDSVAAGHSQMPGGTGALP
jgi:glycosyltransferase involved in cell wall biosynthesis